MKPFELESGMLTMTGVFYPTGYMFLMFPTEGEARSAGEKLEAAGFDDVSLLTAAEILEKIVRTLGGGESLPSAGTEGDTVRQFSQLASKGHHAILVKAPSAKESDQVMELLQGSNISYGQKYRHLVIEDLV